MSCPHSISRAYIRAQTDSRPRSSGIVSRPRLSDYAKTFAMGSFWFASLASVVIAIGSLT